MNKIIKLWVLFFLSLNSAHAIDIEQIEKDLKGDGITGWIHGADETQGLIVFTFRSQTDFFDYIQMSIVPSKVAEINKTLLSLHRHDKVKIQGVFLKNKSPQKHIKLSAISVVEKFKSPYPTDPYQHQANIPEELQNLTHATFLVHAIAGDGKILVLEYKDSIIPVFVKNPALTQNLFRNDLIELNFVIQTYPDQPLHLLVNESVPNPIEVLESISALHGKPASIEGALILFPKSPEIIFNVFAVEQKLTAGLSRQYTIVNFSDGAVFAAARAALQKAWDQHPEAYINSRNKLVSTMVKVKVTGTFNEIDPNQANPQVLIESLDDIQILE